MCAPPCPHQCVCVCIMIEWAHEEVCEQGNPVLLVSSFLSEIKVKWVIYHEDVWLGHFPLVCVHKYAALLKVCGGASAARECVCVHVHTPAAACVHGGHLSFACAMINGLHWAVQPCMLLGLSFYAVSN